MTPPLPPRTHGRLDSFEPTYVGGTTRVWSRPIGAYAHVLYMQGDDGVLAGLRLFDYLVIKGRYSAPPGWISA